VRSIQSTLFTLLTASTTVYADTTLNLTQGVSLISHDAYELHMTVFWICVAIGVMVFGTMFYSMFYHRKSRGAKPASFHSHTWVEITWTVVPFLILVLMAIPATKVLINMNNVDKEDVTIKITGYQWKWHYEYLEDGVSFFSNLSTPQDQIHNKVPKGPEYLREVDHPMVVPIHKKIRFLVTSNDVNHSWWVPDLGVKRDAIAGFINEAWTMIDKPGTYRGQCAELCGINHAFMPIVVIATTDEGYKNWIAEQKGTASKAGADTNKEWTMQELMTQGEKVYSRICAACHQPGGTGLPPTFPALKGSKVATGPVDEHVNTVFNGKSGTAMQAFKGQLSDVELASVITYERNAWGNNAGTLVQPIQIKALRDGKSLSEALTVKPSAASATTSPPPATTTHSAVVPPANTATSTAAVATPTTPVTSAVASAAVPSTSKSATVSVAAPTAEELKAAIMRGEKVYLGMCATCHQISGQGMPPTFPALQKSKIATGPVADHIHMVMYGKQGTAMQAFKDQYNDQDLADVITYERNAWGNNTGSLVRLDDIKAARQSAATNKQQGETS
jgi:cytochrome c oxidase subunit 2